MAKSKLSRIEKRKRLEALFERGGYVTVRRGEDGRPVVNGDAHPDDIKIWVGPPNPFQREMAIREAQASRSRAMLEARDNKDSQTYVNIQSFVRALSMESLIDFVLEIEETDRLAQARRDVLAMKEWEDFNALRDAMRQFEEAGSPFNDPEWKPLLDKDVRFGEQVEQRSNELRDNAREGLSLMPRPKLEERAVERRIEQAGSAMFVRSYEEWMLFYACRDDEDHNTLWFDNLEDMKSQPEELQAALAEKLTSFVAEVAEAKNLQGAASGSTSSVPPVEPETSEASIHAGSNE